MNSKLRLQTIRFEVHAAAKGLKDVFPFVATITYGDKLSDGYVGGTETIAGGPYRVNIPAKLLEAKISELGQHYSDMVAHNGESVSVKVQGRGVFAAKDLASHNKSIRVGEFVSAWVQKETDGSVSAKASGFLYRESDPELVDKIIALSRDGRMGFSYDLVQVASDVKELAGEKFLEITAFEWRGATILERTAAAYEDTALAANKFERKEQDMEMDEKKLLETITSCLTPFKADVINEIGKIKTDFAELKDSHTKLAASVAAGAKPATPPDSGKQKMGMADFLTALTTGIETSITKALQPVIEASKAAPKANEGTRKSLGPLDLVVKYQPTGAAAEGDVTVETFDNMLNLIKIDKSISQDQRNQVLASVGAAKIRFLKEQMSGGGR